ncbi:uncharacterized protein PSANT_01302 [Moesziomyces antarcticus]|uniref:Uncharacterized protein n=1 Tax=Pseudozyma antarctica TaxID=84753 RepID=A0A5C3FIS3_PSEA2|nr:uncharacterized protein PSANT_01302 [Moesziomyces antarcticus]
MTYPASSERLFRTTDWKTPSARASATRLGESQSSGRAPKLQREPALYNNTILLVPLDSPQRDLMERAGSLVLGRRRLRARARAGDERDRAGGVQGGGGGGGGPAS